MKIVEKWADPARSCGLHSKASKTGTAPDPHAAGEIVIEVRRGEIVI